MLAINGKPPASWRAANFLSPWFRGAGGTSVTIQFREFGIRIAFLPKITPRGTIQLQVSPEVSALDFAHAVSFQGTTIPALSTRRVQTEVELESGQSFVIAGLMDNSMTETMNKMPGLSSIPLLGKLFQSKVASRNNSELLVIVTPEIVRPIPAGQPLPTLNLPHPFLPGNSDLPMMQPGMDKTGPVPVMPPSESMPVEQLVQQQRQGQAAPAAHAVYAWSGRAVRPRFGARPRAPASDAAGKPGHQVLEMYPLTIGLAIENRGIVGPGAGDSRRVAPSALSWSIRHGDVQTLDRLNGCGGRCWSISAGGKSR